MENPRLRFVEAHPVVNEGRRMVLLRDPGGISESQLVVSREVAFMISLMDGTRSLRDIQEEFMRASGELVYLEQIEQVVEALDTNLLLQSPRYEGHLQDLKGAYAESPVRPPLLAGAGYPANRMELLQFLDGEFRKAAARGGIDKDITGIVAPHIDYQRGMGVYREIYGRIRGLKTPLVVIFGTCHQPMENLWAISLKDYATPLDTVSVPGDVAGKIRSHPLLRRYIDEWPHRSEHSIELQLPLLQFVLGEEFAILPILTDSLDEHIRGGKDLKDPEIGELLGALRDLLADLDRPCIIVSGADLAHIGAQFGDRPVDPATLARSKEKDLRMLESVRNVDPDGFFGFVKAEGDSRRICGLAPIFFQLKLLEGCRCEVVGYDQWSDGNSSVSFAGAVFYGQ